MFRRPSSARRMSCARRMDGTSDGAWDFRLPRIAISRSLFLFLVLFFEEDEEEEPSSLREEEEKEEDKKPAQIDRANCERPSSGITLEIIIGNS